MLRSQSHVDEDRLNKLLSNGMSRRHEKRVKKNDLAISGRNDPANVLGFRQLKVGGSATVKNGSTARQRGTQLAPLMTASGTAAKLDLLGNSQMQQQVQGMLSDLNRVKNMNLDAMAAPKQLAST